MSYFGSLVPRPYFFLLLSSSLKNRQNEAAKKEMGVQLRPVLGNRVIHEDFYERGRYVAHNRYVRYSPTHSELLSDCTETLPRCQATEVREPAWLALVTVATC